MKGFIYLGTDETGKEIRRYASATTRLALDRKLAELKRKYITGEMTVKTATVAAWAIRWLETKKKRAPATYADYKKIVDNHIIPNLGNRKCHQVKQIDVQNFIDKLDDRPRTAQKVVVTLKAIFDSAVINKVASSNPVIRIERPSAKAKRKRALTTPERAALARTPLTLEDQVLVGLMLRCGLRRQEAAAMHVNRIKIKRDGMKKPISARVYVDQVVDFETNMIRPYPKTMAGMRSVPVFDDFLPDLVKYADKCSGYLFLTAAGGTMTENSFKRRWEKIRHHWNIAAGGAGKTDPKTRRYRETIWGIGKDISPHLLRHTFASDLADYGYTVTENMVLCGHADAKTTLEIYAHKTAEDIDGQKGNVALSELLSKTKQKAEKSKNPETA